MTACVTPCQFGQSPDRRRPRRTDRLSPNSNPRFQIRSHAQKYFLKVQKNGTGEHIPPPRPKRKSAQPYPQKAAVGKHAKKGGGAGAEQARLEAQLAFLQSLYLPETVPPTQRLALSEGDRRWFLERFGQLAPRSGYEAYAALPEGYVKFLAFGGRAPTLPEDLVIFNKVGDAYGFLTDVAYFVEQSTQTEFLLAATVYVNANGIFNDDRYEYETLGLPFLEALGQQLLEDARRRPRERLAPADFERLIPWPS